MNPDDAQKLLISTLVSLVSICASLLAQKAIKSQKAIKADTNKNADKLTNSDNKLAALAIQAIADSTELTKRLIEEIKTVSQDEVKVKDAENTQLKMTILSLQKELEVVRQTLKDGTKT